MSERPSSVPTGPYYVLTLCDADEQSKSFAGPMGDVVIAGRVLTPADLLRWLAVESQTGGVNVQFVFEPRVHSVPGAEP